MHHHACFQNRNSVCRYYPKHQGSLKDLAKSIKKDITLKDNTQTLQEVALHPSVERQAWRRKEQLFFFIFFYFFFIFYIFFYKKFMPINAKGTTVAQANSECTLITTDYNKEVLKCDLNVESVGWFVILLDNEFHEDTVLGT